ncbi:NYN domain-containing protein, partial [Salmonella enterica]|uniref:NYN domain-containing protein n=1 Tax=Salmonella enterica TaxID=28901 RepID=UPI0039E7303A
FTRLASRIREQGLEVYGIGARKTPEAFRKACKHFIYLENLGDDGTQTPAPSSGKNLTEARDLLFRAMDSIDQGSDWYALGRLGQ